MNSIKKFTTSDGEIVSGDKLKKALQEVGDDWVRSVIAVRKEDAYNSCVWEETKDKYMIEGLEFAQRIKEGSETGFTVLQRLNQVLTKKCIGLLGNG